MACGQDTDASCKVEQLVAVDVRDASSVRNAAPTDMAARRRSTIFWLIGPGMSVTTLMLPIASPEVWLHFCDHTNDSEADAPALDRFAIVE